MRAILLSVCAVWFIAGCQPAPSGKPTTEPSVERPAEVAPEAKSAWTPQMLEGDWTITYARGAHRPVKIDALPDRRVVIGSGDSMSGVYQLAGDTLTIIHPRDKRFESLTWQIKNPDELILIDSPSDTSVGSNYIGTRLTRMAPAE